MLPALVGCLRLMGGRMLPGAEGLLSQQRQGGLLPLAGPLLCAAALRPPGPSSLCSLPRAVSDAAAGGAERHLSTAAAEAQPQQQQEGQLDSLLPEDRMGSSQEASTSGEPAGPGGGPAARAFVTESRRVTSARKGGAVAMQGSLEGIVHISNTFNNIIMTLTDKQGFIKTYTSAGQVGFKGARKSQPVAAERAAEELARRAQKLGYTTVQVKIKGPGNTKQYAVQSLHSAGMKITHLMDVTPIPYNGCRPPKKRRV